MARIECNVEKCSHNESGCCYADRVNIGGISANLLWFIFKLSFIWKFNKL